MNPTPRSLLVPALLALLLLGGCAALQEGAGPALRLPAIVERPTGEHHPGKFVWHDLLTPDTLAARTFYGELLGWSFREREGYVEIYSGERRIGGMLEIRPGEGMQAEARWLPAMSVPDVDAAARRVPALGGRVINGPMDLGERGRAVLVEDPEGAHLLLLHSPSGDPPDREPAVGEWLWNEVWSLDAAALAAFYRPLGGYSEVLEGDDYLVLVNEGRWRAGIRRIEQKAYAGRWVPVVRVADPAALLEKVETLGGVVWIRPEEARTATPTALISDSAGALLILQQWDFHAEEE